MNAKQEKIKQIKDITQGRVDPYLLSLGFVKALDETVLITQRENKHFIEGIEVDINLVRCNTAIMPDNERSLNN